MQIIQFATVIVNILVEGARNKERAILDESTSMENLAKQLSSDSLEWNPLSWYRKWRELRNHVKQQRSICPNIGNLGKSVKEYYFDLFTEDGKTSVAVKLLRDQNDPKLFVYHDCSWSFPDMLIEELSKSTVDTLYLVPKKPDGSTAKHDYEISLYDVQYIKQLNMKQTDKTSMPPKGIEIGMKAPTRRNIPCFSPSCFVSNRFLGGSYYAMDTALRELRKQIKLHGNDTSKEFSGKLVKQTPLIKISPKFVKNALAIAGVAVGATIGFVAPWSLGLYGAVNYAGLLSGVALFGGSANIAGHELTKKVWPVTASEKIFDKLWCLSNRYIKHNQGRSFYYCQDAYKNFMLVPWKLAESLNWDCSVF
jgi:hypothetical protein